MTREEKDQIIGSLVEQINNYKNFYLTDTAGLNAEATIQLRRLCFQKEVKVIVVKNSLLRKAFERIGTDYEELYGSLVNTTSVLFSTEASVPAKLIKEFNKKNAKPVLKGAYVQESVFIGAQQLETLASIKSKEEMIGEVIAILQSPAKNVLSALQSGKNILAGVVKTLSEREA